MKFTLCLIVLFYDELCCSQRNYFHFCRLFWLDDYENTKTPPILHSYFSEMSPLVAEFPQIQLKYNVYWEICKSDLLQLIYVCHTPSLNAFFRVYDTQYGLSMIMKEEKLSFREKFYFHAAFHAAMHFSITTNLREGKGGVQIIISCILYATWHWKSII